MSNTTLPNFWNEDHPLSKDHSNLYDLLVPTSGHCDSIQGELIRASSKIQYDWFNNGWGCNNWSGAVVFLRKFLKTLPIQQSAEVMNNFYLSLSAASSQSHGEPMYFDAGNLVTKIHEVVIQSLLDNPTLIVNVDSDDMYDFQEDDYREDPDYEYSDY